MYTTRHFRSFSLFSLSLSLFALVAFLRSLKYWGTYDIGRAHRVARATRVGIVWINTYRVVSPIAEFGGFKDSGYGRESGFQAIFDYTRPKTVWINTSTDPMANPFVMR